MQIKKEPKKELVEFGEWIKEVRQRHKMNQAGKRFLGPESVSLSEVQAIILFKNFKKIAVIRVRGIFQIPIGGITMKYRRQKYQILLIILISFWVLAIPSYALSYSLEEMDVFRPPHWEDPIQESLLANVGKKWTASGWIFCAIIFPQQNEPLKPFSVLPSVPLPIKDSLILRC